MPRSAPGTPGPLFKVLSKGGAILAQFREEIDAAEWAQKKADEKGYEARPEGPYVFKLVPKRKEE